MSVKAIDKINEQDSKLQEEYLQAQRDASEALVVGRETLEAAVRQGEQLHNAESAAVETEYKLDRSARYLRGMTWSGWLANKFSRDIAPPDVCQDGSPFKSRLPPTVYEDVPSACYEAAQAIQNYHANINVLEACDTPDQRETCETICDNMHTVACKKLQACRNKAQRESLDEKATNMLQTLASDLALLRERQLDCQQAKSPQYENSNASRSAERKELFGEKGRSPNHSNQPGATTPALLSPQDPVLQQQDEHLGSMAYHLKELKSIAQNLNQSMDQQQKTLESLDEKSENNLFKSRMVTRRADRMIQKRSWSKTKPEFVANISIRHVKTGKYLAVSSNYTLELCDSLKETGLFGYWKRQGEIFGLQSLYSKRWVGQNLLGALVCNAYSFSRREEWDADQDWSSTPLLCASAGWGNGGYLLVDPHAMSISIGGGGLVDKKRADLWCLAEKDV